LSHRLELLVEVALSDGPVALRAWQELRPELDLQTLEDTAYPLLPLVYKTLETAGIDDSDLARLKGIYRNTWVRNNLLVEGTGAIADAMTAAEIPFLLVGSVGAALRYYPELGLRPTAYVELLLRERSSAAAARALVDVGWKPDRAAEATISEPAVLRDRQGTAVLLRMGLAPDFVLAQRGDAHARLWEAATRIDLGDTSVPALTETDDLLAAIVTGARAVPGRPIQWLVDAAVLLRHAQEHIDWERLVGLGVDAGQGLRLRDAFDALDPLVGPVVPVEIRKQLAAHRPTARERLIYACTTTSVRPLGSFPQAVGEHLADTVGSSAATTIRQFPAFLRRRWEVEHSWQLPLAGARRARRAVPRAGP
jgi:Uncharacterised nucleotidyltransferase